MATLIEGLKHSGLRPVIDRKLRALQARLPRPPVKMRVGFTDQNGPKGGIGSRCAVTVEWPRRPRLHAEGVAPTQRHALDAAFEALERVLLREIDRQRERARRPKKYFVAKRLLEAGLEEAERRTAS